MPYPLCRHIRMNGRRCKSPSLIGDLWCYFHKHLHRTHTRFHHTEATQGYLIPGQHVELIALEDRESVQLSLSVVINALATGQLDTRRATALLYGLQVASSNAARLDNQPGSAAVRTADPTPEGFDLAEPALAETVLISPRLDADREDDEDDQEDEQEEEDDDLDDDHEDRAEDALAPEPQPPLQPVQTIDPAP